MSGKYFGSFEIVNIEIVATALRFRPGPFTLRVNMHEPQGQRQPCLASESRHQRHLKCYRTGQFQ